jgi:hypothetical protein
MFVNRGQHTNPIARHIIQNKLKLAYLDPTIFPITINNFNARYKKLGKCFYYTHKDINIKATHVKMMYGIELTKKIYRRHFLLYVGNKYNDIVTNFQNDDLSLMSTKISQAMEISLQVTKENGRIFLGVYFDAKENVRSTDIEILSFSFNLEKMRNMDIKFLDITEKDDDVKFDRFLFYRNDLNTPDHNMHYDAHCYVFVFLLCCIFILSSEYILLSC